jgi:hypothetical protein
LWGGGCLPLARRRDGFGFGFGFGAQGGLLGTAGARVPTFSLKVNVELVIPAVP